MICGISDILKEVELFSVLWYDLENDIRFVIGDYYFI